MPLLIKNGEIVTASERYVADIFCEHETISRIDRNVIPPRGTEVIDAKGKFVFPGFIDPHVHIYLPFMGTFAKDTYETGSKAALVGGTTTLIEMCCPSRKDDALESFELWMSQAVGKSACDFSFHMGVTKFDDRTEKQLREIVKRGRRVSVRRSAANTRRALDYSSVSPAPRAVPGPAGAHCFWHRLGPVPRSQKCRFRLPLFTQPLAVPSEPPGPEASRHCGLPRQAFGRPHRGVASRSSHSCRE